MKINNDDMIMKLIDVIENTAEDSEIRFSAPQMKGFTEHVVFIKDNGKVTGEKIYADMYKDHEVKCFYAECENVLIVELY